MTDDISKLRELVINSEIREQVIKAMETVFDEWYSKIFPDIERKAKRGFFYADFNLFDMDDKVNKVLNHVAYVDNKNVIGYFQFRLAQKGYKTTIEKQEYNSYQITLYWWDYESLILLGQPK